MFNENDMVYIYEKGFKAFKYKNKVHNEIR